MDRLRPLLKQSNGGRSSITSRQVAAVQINARTRHCRLCTIKYLMVVARSQYAYFTVI